MMCHPVGFLWDKWVLYKQSLVYFLFLKLPSGNLVQRVPHLLEPACCTDGIWFIWFYPSHHCTHCNAHPHPSQHCHSDKGRDLTILIETLLLFKVFQY